MPDAAFEPPTAPRGDAFDRAFASAFADDGFVRGVARRLVRDAAEADDLAQDAWMEALRRRPDARPSLRAWFARVLSHLASNRARGERRRGARERDAARPEVAPPEVALLEREETRRRLVEAVVALGKPQSTVLVLRFFDDLAPREIARRLDLPVETVRTHLKRGLAKLRERLAVERDRRGASVLSLLPCLLPRGDLTAALFGAAVVAAKTKAVSAAVVVACVVGGAFYATRDAVPPPKAPGEIVRGVPREPAPPATFRGEAPSSAPVARAPFVESAPASAPTSAEATAAFADGPPSVVRGTVLDRDGAPVAGALVVVGRSDDPRTGTGGLLERFDSGEFDRLLTGPRMSNDVAQVRRTGPDGRFLFQGLPASERTDVGAIHRDHGVVVAAGLALGPAPVDVALRFEPGVAVVGRVTGPDDAPVEGAHIFLMSGDGKGSTRSYASLRSDADGCWRTPPLPFPTVMVSVQAEGFMRGRHTPLSGLDPSKERERRADHRLRKAPVVTGTIRASDGSPERLAARLGALGADPLRDRPKIWGSWRSAMNDAAFAALGHDEAQIDDESDAWRMTCSGEPPKFVSLWIGSKMMVEVPVTAPDGVELVYDPARLPSAKKRGEWTLKVRDESGLPVVDATATTDSRAPGPGYGFAAPFESHGAGLLRLASAEPGFGRALVDAPGYARAAVVEDVRPAPQATETIVILRKAKATVRVLAVDSAGAPLNGTAIDVVDEGGRPIRLAQGTPITNAEGRATIAGLAEATYSFLARTPRKEDVAAKRTAVRDGVEVRIEIKRGVDVLVKFIGAEGPFTSRFLGADDHPLLDESASGSQSFGTEFHFRLPPGPATLEVFCPTFELARVRFDVKEGAVVTVLMKKIE
jgi:RNA polymerase sigma factor (sigma-70 family)